MNRSKEIEDEWISLAPKLAPSGFITAPYRVPEGYFQRFYDRLIMIIRTGSSGGLSTGNLQETPAEESAAEEIEVISPLLAGLSRKMPYQVPEGYFSGFRMGEEKTAAIVADFGTALPLDSAISDSETAAPPPRETQAPVIKMKRRSWMRIGVGAAITAVILTSAFFYFRPGAVATVAGELAQVSDQDMENFVATHDMPPSAGDSTVILADVNTPSFSDNDITDLMSNVSDTELEDYASNDGPDSNLN